MNACSCFYFTPAHLLNCILICIFMIIHAIRNVKQCSDIFANALIKQYTDE